MAELENAVAEVAKILEQIIVVGVNKLSPAKFGIASFRTPREQVVTPHVDRHTGILGAVTEDANAL